jgi:hypothetical protein
LTGSVYSSVHFQRFAYSNQEVSLSIDEIGSVQSETAANKEQEAHQLEPTQDPHPMHNAAGEAITFGDLLPDITALCDEFFSVLE